MANRVVTGLYDSYDDAVQTVRELQAARIPASEISMVANRGDGAVEETSGAAAGAGTGATAGAAVGGGVGLLTGLGMMAIPGVGPVVAAGWLVATAVGAVAGAAAGGATGGLIGAMTDAGVSREHASVYAEGVRRGGTLVSARVDDSLVATAEAIMQRHGRIDPVTREQAYRAEGWSTFDETAAPYTRADIERERARYTTAPRV